MISSVTCQPGPSHVLLVEDSGVLRERLAAFISGIDGFELIGNADTENGAIELARATRVDVVVLDLHLKQGTGFGVMRALASKGYAPTIIILSNYDLPEYRSAAEILGAKYFLDKARQFGQLASVLDDIRQRRLQHDH